tara:strand:- start:24695 stop:24832 length:138 start_codon:yes stop_codon:yes gene_type:complete
LKTTTKSYYLYQFRINDIFITLNKKQWMKYEKIFGIKLMDWRGRK